MIDDHSEPSFEQVEQPASKRTRCSGIRCLLLRIRHSLPANVRFKYQSARRGADDTGGKDGGAENGRANVRQFNVADRGWTLIAHANPTVPDIRIACHSADLIGLLQTISATMIPQPPPKPARSCAIHEPRVDRG